MDNREVKVTNRDNGTVSYTIPDLNIRRTFAQGETKDISVRELKALTTIRGGEYIIKHCLLIQDKEVTTELLNKVEPEYFYNRDTVIELLLYGTLDQLLDALDYAPEGVIDLIKSIAVELKINDISKRQAIFEKTGFNVNAAVRAREELEKDAPQEETAPKARRTTPISTETQKIRIIPQ